MIISLFLVSITLSRMVVLLVIRHYIAAAVLFLLQHHFSKKRKSSLIFCVFSRPVFLGKSIFWKHFNLCNVLSYIIHFFALKFTLKIIHLKGIKVF